MRLDAAACGCGSGMSFAQLSFRHGRTDSRLTNPIDERLQSFDDLGNPNFLTTS